MMASSATSLSNMLLLAGQYHDALRYVDTAEAYTVCKELSMRQVRI